MTTVNTATRSNKTGNLLADAISSAIGHYDRDWLYENQSGFYREHVMTVHAVQHGSGRGKIKAALRIDIEKSPMGGGLHPEEKQLVYEGMYTDKHGVSYYPEALSIDHSDFEYDFEKAIVRAGVIASTEHEKDGIMVPTTKESLALGDGFLILENGTYRPWKELTRDQVSEATKLLVDKVVKKRTQRHNPLESAVKQVMLEIGQGKKAEDIDEVSVHGATVLDKYLIEKSVGVTISPKLTESFERNPGYRKTYLHSMMPKLAEQEDQPDLVYVAWAPGVFCYFDKRKARFGMDWQDCFEYAETTRTPTTAPLLTFDPHGEYWTREDGINRIKEVIKTAETGNQQWRHNLECIIEDDLTRTWFMNLLGAGIIGRPKRPRAFVSVNGAPNAGKSSLFEEILQPLFGDDAVVKVEKEAFFKGGDDSEKKKHLASIGQAGAYFIDEADDKELDNVFLKEFTGAEKIKVKVLYSNEAGRKKSGIPFFLSNGHLKWNKKVVGLPGRFVNIHFDNGKREMAAKGLKMYPLKEVNLNQLGMLKELYDGFRRVYELCDSAEIEDQTFQIEEILPEELNVAPGYDDILLDDPIQGFHNTLINSRVIEHEERSNKRDYVKFSGLKTFLDMYNKENSLKLTQSQVRTWYKENIGDMVSHKTMVLPKYVWGEEFQAAHGSTDKSPAVNLPAIAAAQYHPDWYGVMTLPEIAEAIAQR